LIGVGEQPVSWTPTINLYNAGWQSLHYTVTVDNSASVVPGLTSPTTGTLSATKEVWLQLSVPGFSRTVGTYTGTVTASWYAVGAGNKPKVIDLQMIVVSDVHRVYLPLIMR
jgi:hypothetical protein